MEITSFVIDNFLENPDLVRQSALESEFNFVGDFPGVRSTSTDDNYGNYIKSKLETVFNKPVLDWQSNTDTGKFQLCLENDKTWIHHDPSEWTGILYLTPDAPVNAGTAIWRHKKTKIFKHTTEEQVDSTDSNDWEGIVNIGNVYNRMALFKGHLYHSSVIPGFGHDKYSGRLTQVFFFNTTPKDK
jgi:hypothetical protein